MTRTEARREPPTRARRARPMSPDDRRQAIVDAVVPLLLQHGDEVSTRQIAEAAGIAEGTIFRVFPDKPALLMAAAAEVMNPTGGYEELQEALAAQHDLRSKVRLVTERLHARSEQVMVVMMALRRIWTSQGGRAQRGHRAGAGNDPREFFAESNRALHAMLTDLFTSHRDELRVSPDTAAVVLRTLVLGSRHPGSDPAHRLTAEQITDVLLDGVAARPEEGERRC